MDNAPQPAPQDRGRLSALLRLWPFARPYRGLIALTFCAALAATLAQLAVPLVTAAVVDGPIADGDRAALIPLLALALLFGVAEAGLFFLRRWAMNKSCLRIERDLRDTLYQRLQRLPVAFHDRWASGQLLSRATTDVSTVRRFVGFAAVFLVVNLITCVVVLTLLLVTYWPLGLAVLLTTVPLSVLALRWERRYNLQSRAVQDEQGELTTDVEEAVQGIRVVKSLGRSRLVFDRYDAKATRLRRLELDKVRTLALLWCIFELHPQVTLAVILVGGAVAVNTGALTIGGLVGFVALFTVLLWPILSLGFLFAFAQETASACDRIGELLDAPITIADRPGVAPADLASPARLRFEDVGFTYAGSHSPVLDGVDLDIAPGETVALVGRDRVRQDHADRAGRPAVRRHRRPGHPGRRRRPRPAAGPAAQRRRRRLRGRDAVLDERPGEPHPRPARGHRRRRRRGAAGRPGRLRARPAVGARHPDRRAGPVPVRRPAAAAGTGPRRARPAVGARPRRPAVGAGRAHRGAGRAGAARRAGRDHGAGGRPPAVHRAAGRPGGPAGRRPDRRRRHAQRAARRRCPPTGTCWRRRASWWRARP